MWAANLHKTGMARREDEFYRRGQNPDEGDAAARRGVAVSRPAGPADDDEIERRAVGLDEEEDSPFLRGQKRVPVRRGPVTKKAASRIKLALVAGGLVLTLGGVSAGLYAYGSSSWRFRIDSSDNLEIAGIHNVSHGQVMEVFGADIGRNIFFVPLSERKKQLEEIAWVESATVMRLLPNRLRVNVVERTPLAFVRIGSKVSLIDAAGVVMDISGKGAHNYSFPVIVGMEANEPLSTRAARMKIYARVMNDLDGSGARYSEAISEVELNDPEDVKATVADAHGAVLLHLGDGDFLERYKIYLAHAQEWRQQFSKLDSVDLRYDRQVIVNPDSRSGAAGRKVSIKPALHH